LIDFVLALVYREIQARCHDHKWPSVVKTTSNARRDAELIWRAAVDAARPREVIHTALLEPALRDSLHGARRIIVVGAGKAGAAMSETVESELADLLDRMEGIVNVPAELVMPLKVIRLHGARPSGSNQPTKEGVAGAAEILRLVGTARQEDVVLCLWSGGGSALLPAPVDGVTLGEKQQLTHLLHECGATINEMNAVRKHLSRIKGGRLAQAFHGKAMWSLIISDVVGDPLDVIASGPTAPDPTTYDDALAVLDRYDLRQRVTHSIVDHLNRGVTGLFPDTPNELPDNIVNRVIANISRSLAAASAEAEQLGYVVSCLGGNIQGETYEVAAAQAELARGIIRERQNIMETSSKTSKPSCLLSGGETTVTLGDRHGLGGRNQEFVLAAALKLGHQDMGSVTILSAGTDGEDGPTDAAGAFADGTTLELAGTLGLNPEDYVARHDAYQFFNAIEGLFRPGLTGTNVMDVRMFLITPSCNRLL
jgi:hydroxypyruvate reductase/glycerate 2-kinase